MELMFDAMKGTMGQKPYYVAMVKVKQIPNLFDTYLDRKQKQAEDKAEMDLHEEAQRRMNMKRIPEISSYIQRSFTTNTTYSYVFNSITANTEASVKFKPIRKGSNIGQLHIKDLQKFTVADGQHRLMGIKNAYYQMPKKHQIEFGNESIAVVFFDVRDPRTGIADIKRKHQIFTDLNRSAKAVSGSISYAMGSRPVEQITRSVIDGFEGFRNLVDMENTYPKRGSRYLFSAKAIGDSIALLLGTIDHNEIKTKEKEALEFWKQMYRILPDWNKVVSGEVDAALFKKRYLCTHAIVLRSLAQVIARAMSTGDKKLLVKTYKNVQAFDWSKSNPQLKRHLLTENGRVNNSKPIQVEFVKYLCTKFGISEIG